MIKNDDFVIPTPEPFFRNFQEGLNKGIDEIEKYYENISSTARFLTPFKIKIESNSLSAIMLENVKNARQFILLYMAFHSEYSSLKHHSLSDIYDSTQQNAQTLYNESFKFAFNRIVDRPVFFAKVIRNYFSSDINYLFLFSWSTFPSMYNFFTSDFHLESGYELIMQFFSSFQLIDIQISDFLLCPYFLCSFIFQSNFWMKVSVGITNHNADEDIFDFMIECISSCSIYLSFYHKSIIRNLFNITPNRCITFLFNKFLKASFEIILKNDEFLFNSKEIELIQKFLEKYSKSSITDYGKKIIQAFTFSNKKEKQNLDDISASVPLLIDFDKVDQIKSIISYIDAGLLCEMFVFSENEEDFSSLCKPALLKPKINEYFQKGFTPISISRTNLNQSSEEIKIIPKEYQNYWNSILSLSIEKKLNPMQYYMQNIRPKIKKEVNEVYKCNCSNNELILSNFFDDKKDKFVFLNQINLLEKNYSHLNNILLIDTRIKENESLLNSIQSFRRSIMCEYCEKMKNKALNNFIASGKVLSNKISEKISKAIDIILSTEEMSSIPSFIKFCSILNSFEIEMDDNCMNLTDGFLSLINVEKKKIVISMLPYRKAKRILDILCNRFKKVFDWNLFGNKIGAIIKLVEYVNIIDGHNNYSKSNFNLFFKYVLCILCNHIFFHIYLIIKMTVKKNRNSLSFFDEKNKKNYRMFDDVMNEFLGTYKLDIRCLSYIQNCI